MTTLDLTPSAGAAARPKRILGHALIESRLVARNGEQMLLALVIPIGLLLAHAVAGERLGIPREQYIASVLALGLWSTGFTSLAVSTAFERRYGVLERLAATPLRRVDLLTGKALGFAGLALAQTAVLIIVAWLVGWSPRPTVGQTFVVALAVPLALLAFAGLALVLAGRVSAELTLALANLVYLAGAVLGVLVPPAGYPGWAEPLVRLLPTTALAESLRTWAGGGTDPLPLVVLSCWVIGGLLLARKVFRWTS